jgi:hypothetical protein
VAVAVVHQNIIATGVKNIMHIQMICIMCVKANYNI